MKVLWTKEAQTCLQNIEYFIGKDNPLKAIEFVDELILTAESLCENSKRGRIVPELSIENIREIIHKNYRIIYIIKKKSLDILTVFEGHRLMRKREITNTQSN